MEAIDTFMHDGYVGEIHIDPFPGNPRVDYEHIAVLTQLSHSYSQPDDNFDPKIMEAWGRGYNWRAFGSRGSGHGYSPDVDLVERYARVCLDAVAVGWWDDPRGSSRVFGYITRETAEREGITDPLACLNAEMREYAAWVTGEVYGYTVTDPDGETIESVWGYYGDDELDYIRSEIEGHIVSALRLRHSERVRTFKALVG